MVIAYLMSLLNRYDDAVGIAMMGMVSIRGFRQTAIELSSAYQQPRCNELHSFSYTLRSLYLHPSYYFCQMHPR